jgi:hypothetical protein
MESASAQWGCCQLDKAGVDWTGQSSTRWGRRQLDRDDIDFMRPSSTSWGCRRLHGAVVDLWGSRLLDGAGFNSRGAGFNSRGPLSVRWADVDWIGAGSNRWGRGRLDRAGTGTSPDVEGIGFEATASFRSRGPRP